MPGYRGPDSARIVQQQNNFQFEYYSHPMIWKRLVSASGGVDVIGLGPSAFWQYTNVRALLKPLPAQEDYPTPAGQIAEGRFQIVTREPVSRDDKLIWNNVSYRVEGVPAPSTLTSAWVNTIAREGI